MILLYFCTYHSLKKQKKTCKNSSKILPNVTEFQAFPHPTCFFRTIQRWLLGHSWSVGVVISELVTVLTRCRTCRSGSWQPWTDSWSLARTRVNWRWCRSLGTWPSCVGRPVYWGAWTLGGCCCTRPTAARWTLNIIQGGPKSEPQMLYTCNFVKYWPILKILSLL